GDQGLGDVDDDGAAGGELDLPHEGGLDLVLDLVAVEQGDAVLVELDLAGEGRHHLLDEGGGEVVGLAAVDDHLADVGAQVVADGADDDVAFLEQKVGGGGGVRLGLDGVPQLQQVVEVPLQLLGGAADAGGAHDGAHAVGDFQLPQGLPQLAALIPLDATGDAAGAWIVGHQHQVAAGEADEGGEGRAFVAALFLVDLDDDFGAFLDHILNAHPALLAGGSADVFAGDFLQGEEAVALGAVVDEGCLEAGFDPGDLALVDVGLFLFAGAVFDIEVVEALTVDHGDPQFFGLRRID